ncbi:MAG: hypothetical protein ACYC1S_05515 [Gemmatimonadaceae bacterium]
MIELPLAGTGSGRRPRRGEGRRVSTRALAALLVLFASLVGVAQGAADLGCTGSTTAGVARRSAAASPDVATVRATPIATDGTADPGSPVGIPADAPPPVVACSGLIALPIAGGSPRGAAVVRLLPTGRAAVFSGADAPKPLIGPPRLS